uniref:WHIM2 domain-containing protein n=1 Tax=Trypanosoma congolense (strain IL3000) TaxID=1068625 RepID=G0UWD1_TRYCI|nr:conserved hypothetical protein [Trypanosoma congolense IL3000]
MPNKDEKTSLAGPAGTVGERAVLLTQTAMQLYTQSGKDIASVPYRALPDAKKCLYNLLASEKTLLAALEFAEANLEKKIVYGPAVLSLAEKYLSDILASHTRCTLSPDLAEFRVNIGALQRLVALYDMSEDVTVFVNVLSESPGSLLTLSVRDITAVLHNIGAYTRTLRRSLKESGGAAGTFKITKSSDAGLPVEETIKEETAEERAPAAPRGTKRGRGSRRENSATAVSVTSTEKSQRAEEIADEKDVLQPEKVIKLESDTPLLGSQQDAKTSSRAPQRPSAGRPRVLSAQEKKVVTTLNQIIQLLGHIFANEYNSLWPVFEFIEERVKSLQEVIVAERAKFSSKKSGTRSTEPFLGVSMDPIIAAVRTSCHTYSVDEDCHYQFDDDLIHPIAHACLTEVNRIEGYMTEPYAGISEEALAKKRAERKAARLQREHLLAMEAQQAKLREEMKARQKEEQRVFAAQIGQIVTSDLIEDTNIKDPSELPPVSYGKLPFPSVEQYEQALFIWSMIVSIPKPLILSQMPFGLFIKGLTMSASQGEALIEEIVRSILEVLMESIRQSSNGRVNIRGKHWFDAMVEIVAFTKGISKANHRVQKRTPRVKYDEESEESEESEEVEEEGGEEIAEEGVEENEENAVDDEGKVKEIEEEDGEFVDEKERDGYPSEKKESGVSINQKNKVESAVRTSRTRGSKKVLNEFDVAIRKTMENVAELRQLAAWINIEIYDRLNLLQCIVLEVIRTSVVQEEAEKIIKEKEEIEVGIEKRTKELRDEAYKKYKALSKHLSPNQTENKKKEYEEKLKEIVKEYKDGVRALMSESVGQQDGQDNGIVIRPLGMDRYKRIYWRFPFDRHITVQTTPSSAADFPVTLCVNNPLDVVEKSYSTMLLDDESTGDDNGVLSGGLNGKSDDTVPQRVWGVVPQSRIGDFIEGLDKRGVREGALRRNLETLQPYLEGMTEVTTGRQTRSRSQTLGYQNKLKLQM